MSTLKKTLRLRAFAKINAGLKIIGKRPDGYHEIRTIYQTITLHDRLEISLSPAGDEIAVACDNPAVPAGEGNLVHRACKLWRQARAWRGGIRVRLEKVIPLGGGLGGASTDAAATLLGLERLTGDRLDFSARHKLAAALGSDVPLFLLGGRVLGCGRGEEVYPLSDLPSRACLVVFPGFSVSTAEAYREAGLRLTDRPQSAYSKCFGAWPQIPPMSWGPVENDFEQVVFARWPELARLKRRFIRAGADVASLTGSGSAVYALFSSPCQLARASQLIPKGWHLFRTRTLARSGYHRGIFRD
jgi:4-diphosphocytidyl-2-C-methyl-D-erythritol kinase